MYYYPCTERSLVLDMEVIRGTLALALALYG